jgi:hypothetical protein
MTLPEVPWLDWCGESDLRVFLLELNQSDVPTMRKPDGDEPIRIEYPVVPPDDRGAWFRSEFAYCSHATQEKIRIALARLLQEWASMIGRPDDLLFIASLCADLQIARVSRVLAALADYQYELGDSETADELIGIVAGFSPDPEAVACLQTRLGAGRLPGSIAFVVFIHICKADALLFHVYCPVFLATYLRLPIEERDDEVVVSSIIDVVTVPRLLPQLSQLEADERQYIVERLAEYGDERFSFMGSEKGNNAEIISWTSPDSVSSIVEVTAPDIHSTVRGIRLARLKAQSPTLNVSLGSVLARGREVVTAVTDRLRGNVQ